MKVEKIIYSCSLCGKHGYVYSIRERFEIELCDACIYGIIDNTPMVFDYIGNNGYQKNELFERDTGDDL